ncbi:recombinase family protein [uncultured Halovibrio sp.]|uniref:recombinase family protein n=1 Tax=uncultured Halovibrio sp. TaxID=985049 RepID=UPI0025E1B9E6|nr:recombinase family protein [uncultured Halovibrio sp.]
MRFLGRHRGRRTEALIAPRYAGGPRRSRRERSVILSPRRFRCFSSSQQTCRSGRHPLCSDRIACLPRHSGLLESVCDVVIEDLGSGLNCKKPGLRRLLTAILNHEVSTLYLTHKDRLVRFGHELTFQACRWAGTDVVILDDDQHVSFERELTQDVLTLMTVALR